MLGLLDKKFSRWVMVILADIAIMTSSRSKSDFEIDFEIETATRIDI